MKDLIKRIAKALVDHPEQVGVLEVEGEQVLVLKLKGSRKNNFTFLHLSFCPSLADTSLAPDFIKLAAK